MDEKEREIYAQQHKDRVDLNEQQANTWGKFLKRKHDYTQKYGASYADILLKKEREALETEFGQTHKEYDQEEHQQWLDYHENEPQSQPDNLPQFLKEPELPKEQDVKDLEVDMTERAASLLERYRQQAPHNVNVRDSDLKTQPGREPLYPNPFKQPDKEQQSAFHSQTKDLEQSQDLMTTMRSVSTETPKKENELTTENKPMSMSERFSQSLSYTKSAEKTSQSPERGKDIDRE